MPFVSNAQRGYFNANRDEMESQGVNVDEWNEASKGKKLPARAAKKSSNTNPDIFKPRKKRPFGAAGGPKMPF